MKPEKKAGGKTGLSYELLLFITIAEPFELIAVHFLVSRYNTTIAWVVTLSSTVTVALLWVWWFKKQTKSRPEQLFKD
jgi:hypothetical protein